LKRLITSISYRRFPKIPPYLSSLYGPWEQLQTFTMLSLVWGIFFYKKSLSKYIRNRDLVSSRHAKIQQRSRPLRINDRGDHCHRQVRCDWNMIYLVIPKLRDFFVSRRVIAKSHIRYQEDMIWYFQCLSLKLMVGCRHWWNSKLS